MNDWHLAEFFGQTRDSVPELRSPDGRLTPHVGEWLISHRSNLIAIARRNGVRGASADEVADEAVLSALEAFKDRPQHLEKPHAWLIKILSRKIVDFKRRQKKRPSFSDIGREFGETLIDGLAQAGSEEMTEDKWILQN